MPTSSPQTWLRDIILLTFGILILFGTFLGSRPLTVPDEGRYAEIPREMIVSGDYVTPHLNGIKYFEKPPLVYWMQAASFKLFGFNEWAVRIPNALMALLGCLVTYAAGRRLFNRQTGLTASIILATSFLYFIFAHTVTLDMTVSVLLTTSLFTFLCALQYPPSPQRRTLLYIFYGCTALATLTKGLIGIIFPAMIIGSWILLLNEWRLLKKIYLPSGILLFLLIAAPWHILVQIKNPEFAHFYFVDQHFLRYFTQEAKRYQPFWFWIPITLIGFLPWSTFLIQAFFQHLPRNGLAHNKNNLFLSLWASLIFLFFSFSSSKLVPYILPLFPPLAIFTGHYLAQHWQQPTLGIRLGYLLIPVIVLSITIGGTCFLYYGTINQSIINLLALRHIWVTITTLWLTGTTFGLLLFLRHHTKTAFASIALSSVLALNVAFNALPLIDTQSTQSLAIAIKPLLKSGDIVVTYENYYQDLPFYLEQPVLIVNWQGELEFGAQHQKQNKLMMNDKTFWQLWHNHKQIFMVTDQDTYKKLLATTHEKFYLIAKTQQNILLTNTP